MIYAITIYKSSFVQRSASATIESGDDFSHQSTQARDNYNNFDQTIMGLKASQTEEPLNQAPQSANRNGPVMEDGGDLLSMLHSLNLQLRAWSFSFTFFPT